MLPSMVVTIIPKVVTPTHTGPEAAVNLLDRNGECIGDVALACGAFEIAPVPDSDGMILQEEAIHLHPADPQGGFRQEQYSARFDFLAFLFRMLHVLAKLSVQFIEPSGE